MTGVSKLLTGSALLRSYAARNTRLVKLHRDMLWKEMKILADAGLSKKLRVRDGPIELPKQFQGLRPAPVPVENATNHLVSRHKCGVYLQDLLQTRPEFRIPALNERKGSIESQPLPVFELFGRL